MRTLIAAAGLMLLASTAHARDPDVWGVGFRLGTNFIPGQYPMGLPPAVTDDTVKGVPAISKVREDVIVGFDTVYYATPFWRVGILGGFDLGKGMFDMSLIGHYEVVLVSEEIDVLVGGGLGFGRTKLSGEKDALLNIPYYPLRLHAIAMLPRDPWAFQVTTYAQYNLPSNHYYTNTLGVEEEVGTGFYMTFGLELTAWFGHFHQ